MFILESEYQTASDGGSWNIVTGNGLTHEFVRRYIGGFYKIPVVIERPMNIGYGA